MMKFAEKGLKLANGVAVLKMTTHQHPASKIKKQKKANGFFRKAKKANGFFRKANKKQKKP